MAQSTDLYVVLRGYALKNNSPLIDIPLFLEFLKNYANHWVTETPDWARWITNTEEKFWSELSALVAKGKCAFAANAAEDQIYMPFFCIEKLREMYLNSDKMADLPFPDEDFLKVVIPEGQKRAINLVTDIGMFCEGTEQNAARPAAAGEGPAATEKALPGGKYSPAETRDELIKIMFPDEYGTALAPSGLIPRRLLEAAFLKLRNYLQSRGNKDYILHKLTPYMPGRDKYLRDILEQLMVQPTECFKNLESSGDSASLFWACFCSQIKTDVRSKTDLLAEDVAAIQSAYVIDACNRFYKALDAKRREVEFALRSLDQHLERSPFYYTLEDIIKFTNDKGVPLLDIYTKQDLEAHIKKRTTESKKNELPEWLILQGGKNERWYIKKNKYLPLCTKMLIGVRLNVRKEVINRWTHLMKEFRKEPAMEKDEEFDRLLAAYTVNENPALVALMEDPKLPLVYSELERSQANIPQASRIIRAGKLLPLSTLYAFRRRDMVTDAKFLLPFWYSIPVVANIIAFFKNQGKKEKGRPSKRRKNSAADGARIESQGNESRTIQKAAQSIVADMVPQGLSMEEYLSDLENRWSRVIDASSRQNLVSDVRALLRDNLRYAVKVHKTKQLSKESLGEMADTLISSSAALQRLGGKQALRLYMQVYMGKLLCNYR
jgi:hypothetical protein